MIVSSTQTLDLGLIYRRQGARPVMPKTVARLADSMKIIGLKMPIEVRACKRIRNGAEADAFEIITGQHRFEAARSLGWTEIAAFVSEETPARQRLWELDENLQRDQGTEAQRATWHREREAILVEMGVVKATTANTGRAKNDDKLSSYTASTAKALGVDKRTVQRDLSRGKKIAPAIMAEVSGTDLDKGVVLDQLAAVTVAEQPRVLAEIREARATRPLAKPPVKAADVIEDQLIALMNAWNKAGPEARERFLARVGAAQ